MAIKDADPEITAAYQTCYENFMGALKDIGVEEIQAVGQEFDYELHNAITMMPSDEYEEGFVCAEMQKGYKIGDTLIRESMVCVSSG